MTDMFTVRCREGEEESLLFRRGGLNGIGLGDKCASRRATVYSGGFLDRKSRKAKPSSPINALSTPLVPIQHHHGRRSPLACTPPPARRTRTAASGASASRRRGKSLSQGQRWQLGSGARNRNRRADASGNNLLPCSWMDHRIELATEHSRRFPDLGMLLPFAGPILCSGSASSDGY